MYSHVLSYIAMYSHVMRCIAMYYYLLPCIAMYSLVSPCVAMYGHVWPCIYLFLFYFICHTIITKNIGKEEKKKWRGDLTETIGAYERLGLLEL